MVWKNLSNISYNSLSTLLLSDRKRSTTYTQSILSKKNKINSHLFLLTTPTLKYNRANKQSMHYNILFSQVKHLIKTFFTIIKIPYKQFNHFKLRHTLTTSNYNIFIQTTSSDGFTPLYKSLKSNTHQFYLTSKNELLV